jgi:uncharacterized protein
MIERKITPFLEKMLMHFPILSLTGPRQSGKTTLLKHAFPSYKYFNLERPDQRQMISEDPIGFLKTTGTGVIFDEAQNLPELFSYIQVVSDERNVPGQYILSGSQSFLMNSRISQSLAGRVAVCHLLPFGIGELNRPANLNRTIHRGFYPRLHEANINPPDFYPSYLQTYIERDVRSLQAIGDLTAFTRFISLCAGRIGQVLNLSSLANDTGIAVNTARSWLSLLESSFIVFLLQPYYKNYSKRIIKSPKLYFYDTGLACSLLRISTPDIVQTHYLYGSLFENLVIGEIIKAHYHKGIRPPVYYWRESNGTEIDCIIEKEDQKLTAIEIKAGQTFNKDYLKALKRFPDQTARKIVIYAGDQSAEISDTLLIGWEQALHSDLPVIKDCNPTLG